jgi:hypothetical protein
MTKTTKRFPIMAGMEFAYPGTTKNRLHKIGYYVIEFTWTIDGQLIGEREIKRVINK